METINEAAKLYENQFPFPGTGTITIPAHADLSGNYFLQNGMDAFLVQVEYQDRVYCQENHPGFKVDFAA